eukprot:13815544-Alexandrium_andersonii.AAC.1
MPAAPDAVGCPCAAWLPAALRQLPRPPSDVARSSWQLLKMQHRLLHGWVGSISVEGPEAHCWRRPAGV